MSVALSPNSKVVRRQQLHALQVASTAATDRTLPFPPTSPKSQVRGACKLTEPTWTASTLPRRTFMVYHARLVGEACAVSLYTFRANEKRVFSTICITTAFYTCISAQHCNSTPCSCHCRYVSANPEIVPCRRIAEYQHTFSVSEIGDKTFLLYFRCICVANGIR